IFNTEYSTSLDCDLTNQEVLGSTVGPSIGGAVDPNLKNPVWVSVVGLVHDGNATFERR
ncbi:unnamed protein product, partial [Larinioides sclopetarius]